MQSDMVGQAELFESVIRGHSVPHQITLIESSLRQLDPRYTLREAKHAHQGHKEVSKSMDPVPDKPASVCCSLR